MLKEIAPVDLEVDESLEEFVSAVQEIIKKDPLLRKYHFVMLVNDNYLYAKEAKGMRFKPVGPENGLTKLTEQMCPKNCGCKLKTDGNFWWCSGIMCDFIGKEETF